MVKEIKRNKNYYLCEECAFVYEETEWAEKCEKWCRENKSCNMEITSHSVERKE